MSNAAVRAMEPQPEDPAGTFRLTPEEVEELDAADREFDEDEKAGRVVPARDFLASLRAT